MRKLITTTFITLDGVMQAPGGPEEDRSGGFEYGGWSFPYWDAAVGAFMDDTMGKPFDLVLGRKTYDIFAGHWPNQVDDPSADGLNNATKYVASRSPQELQWQNSEQIEGDVIEYLCNLKQTDGPELQVHGSGELIQTLLQSDVVDEMRVLTYPVVVGSGKRLFGGATAARRFTATKTTVAPNGVIMAIYEAAGVPAVGSFGDE